MWALNAIRERLYSKLDRSDLNGCWPWTAKSVVKGGYGRFYVGKRPIQAHAVSLALHEGTDPATLPLRKNALHSCDNPPCCNPAHLRWGTNQENADDRERRRRSPRSLRGERNPTGLSAEDVIEIRRLMDGGAKQADVARRYGIDRGVVYRIKTRKQWGWV